MDYICVCIKNRSGPKLRGRHRHHWEHGDRNIVDQQIKENQGENAVQLGSQQPIADMQEKGWQTMTNQKPGSHLPNNRLRLANGARIVIVSHGGGVC